MAQPLFVQTPTGMMEVSGCTNTPNMRKTMKKLTKRYENLNGYDVAVTYIDSHRPKPDPEVKNGDGGFIIHSIRPTHHHLDSENLIVVDDISVGHSFDIPLKVPEPPLELMPDLEKHWRSLDRRVSTKKFLRNLGRKHLKFHKLKPPKNIFKVGLKLGTELVSSLEKILKEKGYKAGNLYDCQQLVNDIEGELDGAKVAFKDIKYGQALEVKYLNEVCVLYDKDAEERVQGLRKQPLTEPSIFLFETLNFRNTIP